MMTKRWWRVCVGAAVAALGSCALPELTIDPTLAGGSSNGASGGTDGGGAANAGKPSGESGNQSTNGGNNDTGGTGGNEGGAGASTDGGGTDRAGADGGGTDSVGPGGSGGAPPGGGGSGGEACATKCSGSCTDLTTDEKNCGQCGQICGEDQTCADSDCIGPCGTAFDATTGGFVTSPGKDGCWHGLAFVSRGGITTNVTPANFASCGADCQLCISGTMQADPTYATFMGLGVTIDQASSGGAPGAVIPKGSGLAISVTNSASSALRVLLAVEGGTGWCHVLTGAGSQTIPYTAFNTQCWNNEGVYYDGEPIDSIIVTASGSSSVDMPVDFCINELKDQ
jgi:hypothetical protein